MRVLLTPQFAQAVDDHLAAFAPERMMHALGRVRPDGDVLMSHWVLDREGDASGTHCRASPSGEQAMQEVERRHHVTYLGVIHTHPASVPEPSEQDGRALADLLSRNPHLPMALVGVVVSARTQRQPPRMLPIELGELVIQVRDRASHKTVDAELVVADPVQDFFEGAAQRLPSASYDAVRGVHAVVIGCGSLGSVAAEQLVRAGVPRLTLIDPDTVEVHNLTRTVYTSGDVGRLKVDALASRATAINPDVAVARHDWAVDPSAHHKLADIVADADVVLAMADAPQALSIIDVVLHERHTPGVFAGVYAGGIGADIVTVLPGITACYRCTVAPRVTAAALTPGIDYTTGRLSAAVALGADVTLAAVTAARVALGVVGLMRGTDTLADTVAFDGRNFLQLGLAPGFFDESGIFATTPGQHTFQSLWARASGDPDCPDCAGATHTIPLAISSESDRDHAPDRRGTSARWMERLTLRELVAAGHVVAEGLGPILHDLAGTGMRAAGGLTRRARSLRH